MPTASRLTSDDPSLDVPVRGAVPPVERRRCLLMACRQRTDHLERAWPLLLLGSGRFDIHLSVPLGLEYEEVLQEQKPDLGRTEPDVDDVLNYLCRVARIQEIHFLRRPRLKDRDDEMI